MIVNFLRTGISFATLICSILLCNEIRKDKKLYKALLKDNYDYECEKCNNIIPDIATKDGDTIFYCYSCGARLKKENL